MLVGFLTVKPGSGRVVGAGKIYVQIIKIIWIFAALNTNLMIRYFFVLMLVAVSLPAFSQGKAMYTNPKFYSMAKNHKTVAVVPFSVTIGLRPKEREKITDEQLREMQANEGFSAQSALISWFLRKQRTKPFDIEFQDIQTTNASLKKAGIDPNDLKSHTYDELATILGVDAIMGGTVNSTKPMSEGASIAVGLAIGFWGSTNTGNISINLNNGADGKLLWKYDNKLSSSLGSDFDRIIDSLMKKAAKKFPYMYMDKYEKQAKK